MSVKLTQYLHTGILKLLISLCQERTNYHPKSDFLELNPQQKNAQRKSSPFSRTRISHQNWLSLAPTWRASMATMEVFLSRGSLQLSSIEILSAIPSALGENLLDCCEVVIIVLHYLAKLKFAGIFIL